MKKTIIATILLLSGTSLCLATEPQTDKNSKKNVVIKLLSDTSELDVKVIEVNHLKHTVSIEGLNGKPVVFNVSPKVDITNLTNGEIVKATGTESIAIDLKKSSNSQVENFESTEFRIISKDNKNQFDEIVKTMCLKAKLVAYDIKTNQITVETESKIKLTIKSNLNLKEIIGTKIMLGEAVDVIYTQGFIVNLVSLKS